MAPNAPSGGGTGTRLIGESVFVWMLQEPWLLERAPLCQPVRLPFSPLRSDTSNVPFLTRFVLTWIPPLVKVVTRRSASLTTVATTGTGSGTTGNAPCAAGRPATYGSGAWKLPSPTPSKVKTLSIGVVGKKPVSGATVTT